MASFVITGSANDTNMVVNSDSSEVIDNGHASTATQEAVVAAQVRADLGVSNAAANASAIGALQGSDVALNSLVSDLQINANIDQGLEPNASNFESRLEEAKASMDKFNQLALPIMGQYYTGPYGDIAQNMFDGHRLTLEYYASQKNNVKNMRYLENGYDKSVFSQKFTPYKDKCVLALPLMTGGIEALVDLSYAGTILTCGYSDLKFKEVSNIVNIMNYDDAISTVVTELNLNTSNVLCIINWSLPFPGYRTSGYQGSANDGIMENASRIVYHDYTGAVIKDADGVALDSAGSNASGPVVRIFEISHPMSGKGLAVYGISPEKTDCAAALDVIQGYIAAGQNVNIYTRMWGSAAQNYVNGQIASRGLNDKTIANYWSLSNPDASHAGMRQIQGAFLDLTSDFAKFINTKTITSNKNSNIFAMGILHAIVVVKLLDAAGSNLTQANVLATAKSLSLTQAQVMEDGFGNCLAGDLGVGLKASKLLIKTIDANGNAV